MHLKVSELSWMLKYWYITLGNRSKLWLQLRILLWKRLLLVIILLLKLQRMLFHELLISLRMECLEFIVEFIIISELLVKYIWFLLLSWKNLTKSLCLIRIIRILLWLWEIWLHKILRRINLDCWTISVLLMVLWNISLNHLARRIMHLVMNLLFRLIIILMWNMVGLLVVKVMGVRSMESSEWSFTRRIW